MNRDAKNPHLDQAERALQNVDGGRRQSETSFLLRLLGELGHVAPAGVSPAGLFCAALHDGPLMRSAQDSLRVVAMPSQRPDDALRPGDWMLRAIPGTGDVGHVSVLASCDLLTPSALAAENIATESMQPGYYGLVIEAGAFPHNRSRPFARRLLDNRGRVPPNTVVLRPKYSDPGAMTDFPPDEPEPNGVQRAFDIEELAEFAGCPLAEHVGLGEQVTPQQVLTPPTPQGPDSSLANRFIAAHPTRYCTPGQAGSATCQTLVAPRPIRRVVIHTLAVPSTARRSGIEAVVAGWQNAGREASAHYLVDRDGTITQMVREADVAFHTPGNNSDSIGIEHADVYNDPAPLTTQLYERSAALVRDLATRHGFAINNNTVAGHSQVNPNHGDPGPYWDWEYYLLLLAWVGTSAASRPIRLVTAAANLPAAPTGWQVQRRRTIANDHCASQRDPWGATYWRAQPSATATAAEVSLVVDEACTYKLSLWWPDVAGANPAAPVDIEVGCLTSPCTGTSTHTVTVDQRPNAGRWNDVAVMNVTQTPAEVKVRWRRNSAQRGWILVDGVRLLKIGSCTRSSLRGAAEDVQTTASGSAVAEGRVAIASNAAQLAQQCGFRNLAGGLLTIGEVRARVVSATEAEQQFFWVNRGTGALLRENVDTQFEHLVRYWLEVHSTIPAANMGAIATALGDSSIAPAAKFLRLLAAPGEPQANINADARTVAGNLIAGVPNPATPATLRALVEEALRQARRSRLDNNQPRDDWRPWSGCFINTCIREAERNLDMEPPASAAQALLGLSSNGRHWEYVRDAHRRRFGCQLANGTFDLSCRRDGTYHAFAPNERTVQRGDIIVQDRRSRRTQNNVFHVRNSQSNQGDMHGDIVVDVVTSGATPFAETLGGNVENSVRRRRFPLNPDGTLVVDAAQNYVQQDDARAFPALPAAPAAGAGPNNLDSPSTRRIFALLRPVEECSVIPGQQIGPNTYVV